MPLLEQRNRHKAAGKEIRMEQKDLILIGQITGAVGLKGEVKIYSYAQEPERFGMIRSLYVARKAAASVGADKGGASSAAEEHPLAEEVICMRRLATRYKGAMPIVRLEGVDDRDGAEALRFRYVYMDAAELPPLPEGEYYVRELLGAAVVTEDGEAVGTLSDIRTDMPQRLYEVTRPGGTVCLIPEVPAFILTKSPEKIIVRVPEGLLEL